MNREMAITYITSVMEENFPISELTNDQRRAFIAFRNSYLDIKMKYPSFKLKENLRNQPFLNKLYLYLIHILVDEAQFTLSHIGIDKDLTSMIKQYDFSFKGILIQTQYIRGMINCFTFLDNGNLIIGTTKDFIEWNIKESKQVGDTFEFDKYSSMDVEYILNLPNNRLIIANGDGKIRIWNITDRIRERVFIGSSRIASILHHSDNLYIIDESCNLRIWDTQNWLLKHLKLITSIINAVILPNGNLVCLLMFGKLAVYDPTTDNICDYNTNLSHYHINVINDTKIFLVNYEHLAIFDLEKKDYTTFIYEGVDKVSCSLILSDTQILIGTVTGNILIVDFTKKIVFPISDSHRENVTQLGIYGNKIISTSYDKTLKIWC